MVQTSTTIVPEEAERFGRLAADWWDPAGRSAMLHKLNPVRLTYIRDQIDQHWQTDECSRTPLHGKVALDVGCGAGLLAEPLARLGAGVTGIDASPEVIAVARVHSSAMGLEVDYRAGDVQELKGQFDLITCMEVIEHVADPAAFVKALAKRLAPNGLLIMSTPNATGWSKLLMITIAEGLGQIPRGTHDFEQFIAPDRMKLLLADAGLKCLDVEGIAWTPTRGLHLSDDVRLNYLVAAVRA
jgi:2-polyprenyl-6-hydroxyphenyl methylase/3-demethylubiquinone-9 3-methyltransferase